MNICEEFIRSYTDKFPFEEIIRQGRQYYLSTKKQQEILDSLPEQAHSFGLFLGEKTAQGFKPTPGLLELIAKNTTKIITIEEKAAWLFVCGRDIFKENIISEQSDLQSKEVIVKNEKGEVLGCAKRSKQGQVAYKNILDIGIYLRQEKK